MAATSAATRIKSGVSGAKLLARVFEGLAAPVRLRILLLIVREGETTTSAVMAETGLSRPAVSHHITGLGVAGLIDTRRVGRIPRHTLNAAGVAAAIDALAATGLLRAFGGGVGIRIESKLSGDSDPRPGRPLD